MNGEVPGTIYGMSEQGWTDQELFLAETLSNLCQPLLYCFWMGTHPTLN